MIDSIFALLFLTSLICLIIGLIKPSIFGKIIKKELSRKKVALIFGLLTFIFFISFGLVAPKTEIQQSQKQEQKVESTVSNQPAEVAASQEQDKNQESTSKTDNKTETESVEPKPTETNTQTAITTQPAQTQTQAPATTPQYTYYSVVSVVDGDTLKISLNGTTTTLRLIGIDTPETVDPRKPVQCFGVEASNKAKELLSGKKVRIEKDSTQGDYDKYGRLLAYVWRDDGLFYNDYMIKQGYAHEYTYDTPYKYQAQFKANQTYARENQLGLWSPNTCNGNTTTAANSSTSTTTTTSTTGKYYTSSYYTSKYYYPENCDAWKSLSSSYLKSFNSLQELLAAYPGKTLSPQCQ